MTFSEQIQKQREKRGRYLKAIAKNVVLLCFSVGMFIGAFCWLGISGNIIGAFLLTMLSVLAPSLPFILSLRRTGGFLSAFCVDSPIIEAKPKKQRLYATVGSAASDMFLKIALYFLALCGGFFLLPLCILWRLIVLLKICLTIAHLKKRQKTGQTSA